MNGGKKRLTFLLIFILSWLGHKIFNTIFINPDSYVNYLNCMIALLLQVNIVPIIAKADTVAKSELKQFKEKVRERIVNKV